MGELQIFKSEEFGEVRTISRDGEPMFCLADACRVLDIKNSRDAKNRLKEDGVVTTDMGVITGKRKDGSDAVQKVEMTFINESNLYKLIFQSRKLEAEKFADWVTTEVLPSIRKHGGYISGQAEMSPEELMAKALQVAQKTLEEREARIGVLAAENSALTVEKQILQPKADYFDELVDRNLLTNFRETAKQINAKQKDFVNFLLEKKYVYRDKRGKLMPYADRNKGLFEVKECFNEKTQWCGTQTLITPKGRETFRLLYLQA